MAQGSLVKQQYYFAWWGTRHGQPGEAQAGYLVLRGGRQRRGVACRGGAGEGNGERARWSEGEVGRRRGGGEREGGKEKWRW